MCIYKNNNYSEGAIVRFDDGNLYECYQGVWRLWGRGDKPKLISKVELENNQWTYSYQFFCDDKTQIFSLNAGSDETADTMALNNYLSRCGDANPRLDAKVEIPQRPHSEEMDRILPINRPESKDRSATNYSFYDKVYWNGDRLFGDWSQTLSGVCSGASVSGFVYRIQLLKDPEIVGTCSGHYVIKIENTV